MCVLLFHKPYISKERERGSLWLWVAFCLLSLMSPSVDAAVRRLLLVPPPTLLLLSLPLFLLSLLLPFISVFLLSSLYYPHSVILPLSLDPLVCFSINLSTLKYILYILLLLQSQSSLAFSSWLSCSFWLSFYFTFSVWHSNPKSHIKWGSRGSGLCNLVRICVWTIQQESKGDYRNTERGRGQEGEGSGPEPDRQWNVTATQTHQLWLCASVRLSLCVSIFVCLSMNARACPCVCVILGVHSVSSWGCIGDR